MNISYEGYDTKYVTMAGADVKAGDLVKLETGNIVSKCMNDENFIGVAATVRDELVGMQEQGYVELGYTGDIQFENYIKLVCADGNKVKKDDVKGKKYYKILKIDSNNKVIGFLL